MYIHDAEDLKGIKRDVEPCFDYNFVYILLELYPNIIFNNHQI